MFLLLITIAFWGFWIWRRFAFKRRLISKKEAYCIDVVVDGFGLLNTLGSVVVLGFQWFDPILVVFWSIALTVDYYIWKHTDDDDDEPKRRRRAWVKNKLPKPVTKAIPQPI